MSIFTNRRLNIAITDMYRLQNTQNCISRQRRIRQRDGQGIKPDQRGRQVADYGVTITHGRLNNEGPGHNRPDKEAGNNRARASDQGPNVTQKRPLNIQPHRKRLYGIDKLNCPSETYGHRNRQTARGFTNRRHGEWINPLTETRERGRENLKRSK